MSLKSNFIYFIFLLTVLTSCQSNAISFCIESQEIQSENSKGLHRIYIENDSTIETYMIEWQEKIAPPLKLNLLYIPKGYFIKSGWQNVLIDISDFKLKSNSKYTFRRSQGDASGYEIKIITDNKSAILSSNKEKCTK